MNRKSLRVVFVDYMLEPDKPGTSGLSDIVWDMASQLKEMGHDPHIVASYHSTDYPNGNIPVHNFKTPVFGYRNLAGHLLILYRASKIAKELAPDLIHVPEYVSTAVFATLGMTCPLILTVPGNIYHRLSTPNGNSYEWYYTQFLKWAAHKSARHCHTIIAISHEMKQWWEFTGSSPAKTPMIPLGVNVLRFHYVEDARNLLSFDSETVYISYFGRFSIEKGLMDLLTALQIVKRSTGLGGLRVNLVGKGPLLHEVTQFISTNGLAPFVQIIPWVPQDDLKIWYSASDAIILPSYTEGLSRTILEAMICGTPVLGSRISGTEDQVEEGKTGWLFPPHDPIALADIIRRAIVSKCYLQHMRTAVYQHAVETLSWAAVTKRVVNEVYSTVTPHS